MQADFGSGAGAVRPAAHALWRAAAERLEPNSTWSSLVPTGCTTQGKRVRHYLFSVACRRQFYHMALTVLIYPAEFKAAPPGFDVAPSKAAPPGLEPELVTAVKAPPATILVPDGGGGSFSALSRAMRETTIKGAPATKPMPEAPQAGAKLAPALLPPARGPPAKAPPFAKEPPMLGGGPGPLDTDAVGKSPPGAVSFGLGLAHSLAPPAGPASQAGETGAQGPIKAPPAIFKAGQTGEIGAQGPSKAPPAIFKGQGHPAFKAAPAGLGAAGVLRVLTRPPGPDAAPAE
ncbi:unnamed protein product, partial [Prorocentrum cordatum]